MSSPAPRASLPSTGLAASMLASALLLCPSCGRGGLAARTKTDAAPPVIGEDGGGSVAVVTPPAADSSEQPGGVDGDAAVAPDATPGIDGEAPFLTGACMWNMSFNRSVSLDDTTLGHSARDVAQAFARNGPGRLQWFDGSQALLRITADISLASVTIDDPPPNQGYCARFMKLANVAFTVTTDDGRLQEAMVGELVADDVGGPVLSIWPDIRLELAEVQGTLQLPAEWRLPGQTNQVLAFVVNSRANLESPYCAAGELRDETPTSDCTAASGKIVYYGAKMTLTGMESSVVELAATWNWQ